MKKLIEEEFRSQNSGAEPETFLLAPVSNLYSTSFGISQAEFDEVAPTWGLD
ncbi:hypothetical protein LC612_29085 [Nostoc sp. CHAB 5834]|nr:hypothetical protein [Nostoc sp. CHAB 5834]